MEHQHEREGVITLTKHNLIPVNSVIIPEEYQVRSALLSLNCRTNWMELS